MSTLSYVRQLFSPEQCQAYIHALRWKDRPLHCPQCQSQDIRPWGTYHQGNRITFVPRFLRGSYGPSRPASV
jgi:hypothetical protein